MSLLERIHWRRTLSYLVMKLFFDLSEQWGIFIVPFAAASEKAIGSKGYTWFLRLLPDGTLAVDV